MLSLPLVGTDVFGAGALVGLRVCVAALSLRLSLGNASSVGDSVGGTVLSFDSVGPER